MHACTQTHSFIEHSCMHTVYTRPTRVTLPVHTVPMHTHLHTAPGKATPNTTLLPAPARGLAALGLSSWSPKGSASNCSLPAIVLLGHIVLLAAVPSISWLGSPTPDPALGAPMCCYVLLFLVELKVFPQALLQLQAARCLHSHAMHTCKHTERCNVERVHEELRGSTASTADPRNQKDAPRHRAQQLKWGKEGGRRGFLRRLHLSSHYEVPKCARVAVGCSFIHQHGWMPTPRHFSACRSQLQCWDSTSKKAESRVHQSATSSGSVLF